MAETKTAMERLNGALDDVNEQLGELRERFDKGVKRVQDELEDRRDRIDQQWKESAVYRRLEESRQRAEERRSAFEERVRELEVVKGIEKRVEDARQTLLDRLGVVSRDELKKAQKGVAKLEKQIEALNKRIESMSSQPTA